MNIAPVHIDALKALGYTEAEARFLYLVATHSGYFVARQFLAFANAHWGERTTTFWNKLHTQKHARAERFPKSGIVYHLFSRRLYHQIDRENIRNPGNTKSNTSSAALESSILCFPTHSTGIWKPSRRR